MSPLPLSKGGFVYILTNATHTVLYVGVTSDLKGRIEKHKSCFYPDSFTSRYKIFKLVYFEGFHRMNDAIAREKQLKAGNRKRNIVLIDSFNPEWKDLYEDLEKLL